jgi:hypothetical protein
MKAINLSSIQPAQSLSSSQSSNYIVFERNKKTLGSLPNIQLSSSSDDSSSSSHYYQKIASSDNYEVGNSRSLLRDTVERSISLVGDVNGDGNEDILLGYPYSSLALLYYGIGGRGSSNFNNILPSTAFHGISSSDFFGWAVSGIGDINSDGYDDFMISAKSTGIIYIIYGKSPIYPYGNDIYMSNYMNDQTGFRILVDTSRTIFNFGVCISSAGDFNSDGYNDYLISGTKLNGEGMVYLLYGRSLLGNQPITSRKNDIYLDKLNETIGFRIYGPSLTYTGLSIAGLGDINGDNYDDIAVGAVPFQTGSQRSYVIYGHNNSVDITLSLQIPLSDGFVIMGGGFMVSNPGDVNNDGLSDIMISSFSDFSGKSNVYLVNYPRNVMMNILPPSFEPTLIPVSNPSFNPSMNLTPFSPSVSTTSSFSPSFSSSSVPQGNATSEFPTISIGQNQNRSSSPNPTSFPSLSPSENNGWLDSSSSPPSFAPFFPTIENTSSFPSSLSSPFALSLSPQPSSSSTSSSTSSSSLSSSLSVPTSLTSLPLLTFSPTTHFPINSPSKFSTKAPTRTPVNFPFGNSPTSQHFEKPSLLPTFEHSFLIDFTPFTTIELTKPEFYSFNVDLTKCSNCSTLKSVLLISSNPGHYKIRGGKANELIYKFQPMKGNNKQQTIIDINDFNVDFHRLSFLAFGKILAKRKDLSFSINPLSFFPEDRLLIRLLNVKNANELSDDNFMFYSDLNNSSLFTKKEEFPPIFSKTFDVYTIIFIVICVIFLGCGWFSIARGSKTTSEISKKKELDNPFHNYLPVVSHSSDDEMGAHNGEVHYEEKVSENNSSRFFNAGRTGFVHDIECPVDNDDCNQSNSSALSSLGLSSLSSYTLCTVSSHSLQRIQRVTDASVLASESSSPISSKRNQFSLSRQSFKNTSFINEKYSSSSLIKSFPSQLKSSLSLSLSIAGLISGKSISDIDDDTDNNDEKDHHDESYDFDSISTSDSFRSV